MSVLDKPRKSTYQTVSVTTSGALFFKVTDWTYDVDGGFESRPDTVIEFPKEDGTFSDDTCDVTVTIHDSDELLQALKAGEPVAEPVEVVIQERYKASGATTQTVTRFIGSLTKAKPFIEEDEQRLKLSFVSVKGRVSKLPLGLPCNIECSHTVGDDNCGVAMSAHRYEMDVDSIVGSVVYMDPATTHTGGAVDDHFHNGYIEHDGIRITIVGYSTADDPTKFVLMRKPPSSWVGETVWVYAGCDGSIRKCRAVFDNEGKFCGLGVAMPAYHPVFDPGEDQ